MNYLKFSNFFDVLTQWLEYSVKHPHIYCSLIIWLSKPTTNTFTEWCMSLSSWFDSNHLMRWQTEKTLEMDSLEALTCPHSQGRREKHYCKAQGNEKEIERGDHNVCREE